MKKVCLLLAVGLHCGVGFAQSYAGALIAFTKFHGGCEAGLSCSSKPLGMKLFAGTRLPDDTAIKFGSGAIDIVEVGAVRFGSRSGRGIGQAVDADDNVFDVPVKTKLTADGVYIAAGAHLPLIDRLTFTPKLGLAYVTTSLKGFADGSSMGSVSENHIAPYGSLGLEYAGPYDIKLTATVDWTRAKTQGVSATASLIGIGAAVGF